MANALSMNFKHLVSIGTIDIDDDTFKIILLGSGFVFSPTLHDELADVSAYELDGVNGYTTGGATLAGQVVTRNDIDGRIDITWTNASWSASGGPIGPAVGAIIYDDTVVNDPIVGFIDFGGSYTQADGGTAIVSAISLRLR